MTQPLITRSIPVEFLTVNHYILGQVTVSNTGLMGIFADIHTSHIEVHDASLARLVKPDKVINYSSYLWLVKKQILAISVAKRDYVGSTSLIRGGYTRIVPYLVQLTSPVYEVTGTLEWAGRFEFSAIMTDGPHPFLALFDATLNATLFPAINIQSPAIIFNRAYVDTLITLKKAKEG
jgi:hypothetical protein